MAPVRRYLRISKYSVLECRIYLDNPALAQAWLLNPRNPVLPRVVDSIRPLVLPKLREEKERSKKKSTKKKTIKDVVVKDDFEVSMFLTETNTRHSLLVKHKHFHEKGPSKINSNSTKLMGETNDNPVDLDNTDVPILREEDDSDDDDVHLADIPAVESQSGKRPRRGNRGLEEESQLSNNNDEDGAVASPIDLDSDAEEPPTKRARADNADEFDDDEDDDKKKLAMDVTYEGFAIYGRVLCLVVKKREQKKAQQNTLNSRGTSEASGGAAKPVGQARMENWITSTQVPVGEDMA